MKLNKTFLAVATALPLLSTAAFADTVSAADLKERVFGSVFGEYYMPDIDKTESAAWNYMEKDWGYGIELGYYLTENWALRAEFAKLDLKSKLDGSDSDGDRIGIDAMYHLPSMSSVYLVGGLKRMDAVQTTTAVNLGVGYKHFFNQNFGVFAEANRYQGIDESYGDAGIKLGLTYAFGSAAAKPAPAPAPAPAPVPVQAAPADSDGDGVVDTMDRCADTPANHKVDATGCTIYEEKMAAVGDIDIEVRFPFDSAVVPQSQRSDVQSLGAFMQRFPESTVLIEGHASNTGNPAYNMRLSERRANAVADMLKNEFNIAASRITAVGFGVTRPRVEGNTAEAHAANQRIEAKVTAKVKEPVLR
ncbi:OmpA family protein [Rheinheimera nanhaiensis]|uniref:OmpA-OmpF porin, OOP family n=1 Tax=Rheinheimera nanhaiensis E407-8 TaxID=562729 RepID=I1DXV4_9GAMM|nr:OmpA family protein [Rheinheimera nanhaiensis]GAB58882.1 OmpA-OmpF porin, OOP family [Rheinheimera nanhaiensis E407-8]